MTLGGTDPAGLTTRCAQLFAHNLPPDVEIVAVLGLGVDSADLPSRVIVKRNVPNMAAEMMQADLLVTSAGRTVYEAAAVGTPVVVLAQNAREATTRTSAMTQAWCFSASGHWSTTPKCSR